VTVSDLWNPVGTQTASRPGYRGGNLLGGDLTGRAGHVDVEVAGDRGGGVAVPLRQELDRDALGDLDRRGGVAQVVQPAPGQEASAEFVLGLDVDRQRWRTRVELSDAIFEYTEGFYNRRRRHSALDWQSPLELETTTRPPAPSSRDSPELLSGLSVKPGQHQPWCELFSVGVMPPDRLAR
jgi:transposase InsO family protein